jgi:inosine-uridine nucleoside N-ribohydrolase
MKRNKIIIDTDPGHDDALALMLLVKSDLFEIKAVTTVAGNTDIQQTTNNARFLLDLLGEDAPIFSGAKKPLKRWLIKANVHGKTGLAGADVRKKEKLNGLAVDKIIEIVRDNPGKVSLVVIGPETNIAEAFLKDKELPSLIKEIVIMGGAIEVPGNKNRVAEFNVFVDPEAAKIVFDAKVKKVLVPLDRCNEIPLFLDDFDKLKGSKLHKPVMAMMRHFIKGIAKFEGIEGALVYDALATYYLVNPKAFVLKKMDVKIETDGELTRGMSVADRRTWGEKEPNVEVVVKIDRNRFVKDFIKILRR